MMRWGYRDRLSSFYFMCAGACGTIRGVDVVALCYNGCYVWQPLRRIQTGRLGKQQFIMRNKRHGKPFPSSFVFLFI